MIAARKSAMRAVPTGSFMSSAPGLGIPAVTLALDGPARAGYLDAGLVAIAISYGSHAPGGFLVMAVALAPCLRQRPANQEMRAGNG